MRDGGSLVISAEQDAAPAGQGRRPDWNGRVVVTHALMCEHGRALAECRDLVRERVLDTAASAWHRRRSHLSGHPISDVLDPSVITPSRRYDARHRIYQAKVWSLDLGARMCAAGASAALDPATLTSAERRRGGHELVFDASATWLRQMDALWPQITSAIEQGRCTPTPLPF